MPMHGVLQMKNRGVWIHVRCSLSPEALEIWTLPEVQSLGKVPLSLIAGARMLISSKKRKQWDLSGANNRHTICGLGRGIGVTPASMHLRYHYCPVLFDRRQEALLAERRLAAASKQDIISSSPSRTLPLAASPSFATSTGIVAKPKAQNRRGAMEEEPGSFEGDGVGSAQSMALSKSIKKRSHSSVDLRMLHARQTEGGAGGGASTHTVIDEEALFAVYYNGCAMHVFKAPNCDCAFVWVKSIADVKSQKNPSWLRKIASILIHAIAPPPHSREKAQDGIKSTHASSSSSPATGGGGEEGKQLERKKDATGDGDDKKSSDDWALTLSTLLNAGFDPEHARRCVELSRNDIDTAVTLLCHAPYFTDRDDGFMASDSPLKIRRKGQGRMGRKAREKHVYKGPRGATPERKQLFAAEEEDGKASHESDNSSAVCLDDIVINQRSQAPGKNLTATTAQTSGPCERQCVPGSTENGGGEGAEREMKTMVTRGSGKDDGDNGEGDTKTMRRERKAFHADYEDVDLKEGGGCVNEEENSLMSESSFLLVSKGRVQEKLNDISERRNIFTFNGPLRLSRPSTKTWSRAWFNLENCRLFWSNGSSLVATGFVLLSPSVEIEYDGKGTEFFIHLRAGTLHLSVEEQNDAEGWVAALRRGRQMRPWNPTPHSTYPPRMRRHKQNHDGPKTRRRRRMDSSTSIKMQAMGTSSQEDEQAESTSRTDDNSHDAKSLANSYGSPYQAELLINDSNQGIERMQAVPHNSLRSIFHDNVPNVAKAGDILLFKTRGNFWSSLARSVTSSNWDHIGLVLGEGDDLRVLEALIAGGVQVSRFSQFYNCAWYTQYEHIALRRLVGPRERLDVEKKLDRFSRSISGRRYQIKAWKMLHAWYGSANSAQSSQKEMEKDTFCCSEVIAAAYKELGLLRPDIDSVAYVPGTFGSEKSVFLLEGFRLEGEMEVLFSSSKQQKT